MHISIAHRFKFVCINALLDEFKNQPGPCRGLCAMSSHRLDIFTVYGRAHAYKIFQTLYCIEKVFFGTPKYLKKSYVIPIQIKGQTKNKKTFLLSVYESRLFYFIFYFVDMINVRIYRFLHEKLQLFNTNISKTSSGQRDGHG